MHRIRPHRLWAEHDLTRLVADLGLTRRRRTATRLLPAEGTHLRTDLNALQSKLWEAADQLRANSGLKASEYSTPVLGLIFLRYADLRFAAVHGAWQMSGV